MAFVLKIAVIAVCITGFIYGVVTSRTSSAQQRVVTASERFKNITVLGDVPAEEIGPLMNIMSASLRVNCSFCHTSGSGDFEKDGNEHKDIAREMIKMTFDINRRHFEGKPVVTCNTCHNGYPMPKGLPNLLAPPRPPRAQPQPIKYTVAQVIERYEKALGGRARLDAIRGRQIDATRIEPDGKTTEPERVIQSKGKIRVETSYGDYVVVEAFDGEKAWKTGNGSPIALKPFEAEQIAREAQLFANADLKSVYTELKVSKIENLNGRSTVVVTGKPQNGNEERLYFDELDGYLVRRVAATPTVLGDFEYQIDYSEYKSFAGVKLPVMTRFSLPNITWTRRIRSVVAEARTK